MDPIVKMIAELGIVGALFVMWWFERKDRLKADETAKKCDVALNDVISTKQILMQIVEANTRAITSLCSQIETLKDITNAIAENNE